MCWLWDFFGWKRSWELGTGTASGNLHSPAFACICLHLSATKASRRVIPELLEALPLDTYPGRASRSSRSSQLIYICRCIIPPTPPTPPHPAFLSDYRSYRYLKSLIPSGRGEGRAEARSPDGDFAEANGNSACGGGCGGGCGGEGGCGGGCGGGK
ncbi:hypothetical protein FPQ18DRAFT_316782 [Pyronema domesticum]|nr:hypothetical protein FPQ18DRAFT_316782 [Pyronema domesticum]